MSHIYTVRIYHDLSIRFETAICIMGFQSIIFKISAMVDFCDEYFKARTEILDLHFFFCNNLHLLLYTAVGLWSGTHLICSMLLSELT